MPDNHSSSQICHSGCEEPVLTLFKELWGTTLGTSLFPVCSRQHVVLQEMVELRQRTHYGTPFRNKKTHQSSISTAHHQQRINQTLVTVKSIQEHLSWINQTLVTVKSIQEHLIWINQTLVTIRNDDSQDVIHSKTPHLDKPDFGNSKERWQPGCNPSKNTSFR